MNLKKRVDKASYGSNHQGDVNDDSAEDINDLLSDFDSDDTANCHLTWKQHKYFKGFFEAFDKLTVEKIIQPSMEVRCPACACINGPPLWYKGMQPLMAHAKIEIGKAHGELAEILVKKFSRRGLSVVPSDKWTGLRELVCHLKIVWPPIVMVRNTVLHEDKNGKWIGMGNQELLDYFSAYNVVKAQYSYGLEGHKGISLLIFENTAIGYMEAERLHKHFAEQRTDKGEWNRLNRGNHGIMDLPGKKCQLYGYMADKEDLDIFNQHCEGKTKLEFEMRSHHEMVVIPLRQMVKLAKAGNEISKAFQKYYGQWVEKLRIAVDDNRIIRERTTMWAKENKQEMESQVEFFEAQIRKFFSQGSAQPEGDIDEEQEEHHKMLQEENNKMKQTIQQLQESIESQQTIYNKLQEDCKGMQQRIQNINEISEEMQAYKDQVQKEEHKKKKNAKMGSSANEELRQEITTLIQTQASSSIDGCSSTNSSMGDLQCVERLEIVQPKPIGFHCGTFSVPTDKTFNHDFNSPLIPSADSYLALGQSYLKDKKLQGALKAVDIACSLASKPQHLEDPQFWAKAWMIVGDIYVLVHILGSTQISILPEYLSMSSDVLKEVERLKKKFGLFKENGGIFKFLEGPISLDDEYNLSTSSSCYDEARKALAGLPTDSTKLLQSIVTNKGSVCNYLGLYWLSQEDLDKAELAFADAIKAFKEVCEHTNIIMILYNLGYGRRALASKIENLKGHTLLQNAAYKQALETAKIEYSESLRYFGAVRSELEKVGEGFSFRSEFITQYANTYLMLGRLLAREDIFAEIYGNETLDGVSIAYVNPCDKRDRNNLRKREISANDAFREAINIFESLGELHKQEAAYAYYLLACNQRDQCSKFLQQGLRLKAKQYAKLAKRNWQKSLNFYDAKTYADMHQTILCEQTALVHRLSESLNPNKKVQRGPKR